jgi:hypothetical protein
MWTECVELRGAQGKRLGRVGGCFKTLLRSEPRASATSSHRRLRWVVSDMLAPARLTTAQDHGEADRPRAVVDTQWLVVEGSLPDTARVNPRFKLLMFIAATRKRATAGLSRATSGRAGPARQEAPRRPEAQLDARVAATRSTPAQGSTLSQRSVPSRDSASARRLHASPRSSTRRNARPSATDLEPRAGKAILHGHRVSYRTAGKGRRVILLIHGITRDPRQWNQIIPQLAVATRSSHPTC